MKASSLNVLPNDWFSILDGIETAVIADVLDEFNISCRLIDNAIQPITSSFKLVGKAACATLKPKQSGLEANPIYDDFSAVDAMAGPGIVIVLATGPAQDGAVLGEFMTREFQRRGAAGVVTDGMIRDTTAIESLCFPAYSRGTSPLNGARRMAIESIGKDVEFPSREGGAFLIQDGDIIVGDKDGIIVIPLSMAGSVIRAAQAYGSVEAQIVCAMNKGMSRIQALKTHNRSASVQPFRPK